MQLQLPPLADGEVYIGAFGDQQGNLHHSILLPGDNAGAPWQAQLDWAKSVGGDLPSRAELVTCYEQLPEQFQKDAYWSNRQDTDPGFENYAWCQCFSLGLQDLYLKLTSLRARAVRRLPIQSFTPPEA